MTNQDRKKYAKLKEIMAKEFVESIIEKSKERVVYYSFFISFTFTMV